MNDDTMYTANDRIFKNLVKRFDVKVGSPRTSGGQTRSGTFVANLDNNEECISFYDMFNALQGRIADLERMLEDRIAISDKEHAMILLRHGKSKDGQ